jgi:hypothetical protein
MSSSWGIKLESKLTALTETASTETLQALAKWIGFNRKHAAAFAVSLLSAIETATPPRQTLYLQVIHFVLQQELDGLKWDRLAELRVVLAEDVLVPVLESAKATAAWSDKLPTMLKEWDRVNAFGVPTLILQMRKLLNKSSAASLQEAPPVTAAVKAEPADEPDQVVTAVKTQAATEMGAATFTPPPPLVLKQEPKVEMDDDDDDPMKEPSLAATVPSTLPEVTYDFEVSGIPAAEVKPADFIEPCRSVATLQIARDLRNDGAVNLFSLLSGLPEEVRAECAEAAEQEDKYSGLHEDKARPFSQKIAESLLDMDMPEQLQNIRNFRDIVQRQRQARKQVIDLLISSRCNFGANDAAAAFYGSNGIQEMLQQRKQTLVDAMELEGLDVEEEKSRAVPEELAPFTWYEPGDTADVDADESSAKRQRTE